MPEEHLCDLAREALTAGRIPRYPPNRVWGGPGIGASCPICARPIPGWRTTASEHVHRSCLAALVFEQLAAQD